MNVLGISAQYHDSSAALVCSGKIVASAAEERFSLVKHDASFPTQAVKFCLSRAGIEPQEIDAVIFYEEPHEKFSRVLKSTLKNYPALSKEFVSSMHSWLSSKLWIKDTISKKLNIHPKKISYIPHHLSHAAMAFIGSPFESSAVLVVDAVGEWTSTSLYFASRPEGRPQFKLLESFDYPNSLGLVYSAFTAFLGFRVNDGECSTMALAAFGKAVYAEQIRKIIRIQGDGSYDIDQSYFQFDHFTAKPFSKKFLQVFGQPRSHSQILSFSCYTEAEASEEAQYYANIAASVQLVFEEAILALTKKLHHLTGETNLCFGGGAALNCVANRRIELETPFRDLFIPPDPGDGGCALGAALFYAYQNDPQKYFIQDLDVYLGDSCTGQEMVEMLPYLNDKRWQRAPQDIQTVNNDGDLCTQIAEEIGSGKIIAWHQGRFETGPRALGNRSILCDPRKAAVAKRLSEHVKNRAEFRPYAISVSDQESKRIFDGRILRTSKWMQSALSIKEDAQESICGALHRNGTTRAQVCTHKDNALFFDLLGATEAVTGRAALLNTSFNESGLPMVSSAEEALLTFARTDIDILVVNKTIIKKNTE